jgi:ribosomal protein L11
MSMALSKEQSQFYQQTLDMTRKQIGDLNTQIEEELAKVKERLAELQNLKNSAKQIYDGACKILGIENDLEKEDEELNG